MKGLLIAATNLEIARSLKTLKRAEDWHCVITGIGSAATAYSVTKAIEKYRPKLMIQAGIAGSFDKEIGLGHVTIAGSECFGDLGAVESKKRRSVFDLCLQDADQKPFTGGKLLNPHKKLLELASLPVVNAVTVNEVTTSNSDIDYYSHDLRAAIESMEGAAFHYVALMEKVPFLQVRSISNYVGERNKSKWNLHLAIANLNEEVLQIIKKIS